MTKIAKNSLLILLFFIMTGCGFSSGLYKDIIKAQDLITEQKFEKAAQVYEGILLKKPSKNILIKIRFQLGEIYSIYLNDYDKSLKHFNEIAENSNEPLWQVRSIEKIGDIYFENLQKYQKAKSAYIKLINFSPTLKKQNIYKYKSALCTLRQNKFTEAIKSFNELVNSEDQINLADSYYHLGLAYFYKQDWSNAIKNWYEYLRYEKRKDKVVNTKFLIANAFESNEELKKAYNIYYSILGEYPNTSVLKDRLNSLYERRVARKR